MQLCISAGKSILKTHLIRFNHCNDFNRIKRIETVENVQLFSFSFF